jgi:methionyl-tRNA formyltransferase
MKNDKISLVFFGSGPVAAESLSLLRKEFVIEAVVTKATTEIEMRNAYNDDAVFLVSNKKDLDELFATKNFKSSVAVLIDFGIIVSNKIIKYFEHGIVNSHFSLLPELRGADPISFAILEGKDRTGVSLMLLVEAMDEGPILASQSIELLDDDTSIKLSTKLINLSNELLVDNLQKYLRGEIKPKPQNTEKTPPTYTRKLTKQDGIINWNKPAEEIVREIRAFITWPKSKTKLGDVDVIITKAHSVPSNSPGQKPGDIQIIPEANVLIVETKIGYLCIEKLKPAGKKEMDSQAFLAGYKQRLGL